MKTILVVDDMPEILNLIKATLMPMGYDVLVETDLTEAFWFCKQLQIDFVITDLNFDNEDKTGVDLIKELNRIDFNGKIIVMSGYLDRLSERDSKILESIDCILEKPFRLKDLIECLD